MISQHLKQAIAQIQTERDNAVKLAVQKVTAEEITPFNVEVDKKRDKAIQEKTVQFNSIIAEMQQSHSREKQEIVAAAEKKKKENAELIVARETAAVTIAYDKTVSKLLDLAKEMDEVQK